MENQSTCKYCENSYDESQTYDLSDNKDKSEVMCIDCIIDVYYDLELS
jgi:hypothetical protein